MSYHEVLANCEHLLKQAKRPKESLKILAVSKLQPVEKIRELYEVGHRTFAENYVQEALEKQSTCSDLDIEWHLIGSLQKNKVKMIIGKFTLIHGVDSLKLAEVLSKAAEANAVTQKILLQVNLAGEASKGGFSRDELFSAWSELQVLPGISIEGFMTMPPLTENPEEVRSYFRDLRELCSELRAKSQGRHSLTELSMGTSHDYHVAIEEGATIVRLGTILFGERAVKPRTQP